GTTHANSPMDALVRLETLASMGDSSIPLAALRRQIAGAVHIVIQAKRLHDGSRKITHVSEVLGVDEHGKYTVQDLFKFVQTGIDPETHKIHGQMEPCGNIPTFFDEIEVNGLKFDVKKFAKPKSLKPTAKELLEQETARLNAELAAKGGKAAAAPAAVAPANPIAHLSPAQQKAVTEAAAKAKMTVAAYYTWLMNRQKQAAAAKAAAPAVKKPDGSEAA
ncbi:MAG: hypothetical protein ACXVCG_05915, partial [Bdellovibrionota bacterium]